MSDFISDGFRTILFTKALFIPVVLVFGYFTLLLARDIWRQSSRGVLIGFMGLLLLGLVLRLGWIGFTQPDPVSDYELYWNISRSIYEGYLEYDYIDKHPGIILLLTLAQYIFGPNYFAGWLMNLSFSLVLLSLLFTLTRQVFNTGAAFLALFLAAIHPQLVAFSALFASEIPSITFVLMIAWGILKSQEQQRLMLGYWVGLGILLYGSVMTRTTSLLFVGLVPIVFLLFRREVWQLWLKQVAVMGITVCLLLSTWVFHQYLNTGTPKLFWGSELWLFSTAQYENEGRFNPPKPSDTVYHHPKVGPDWDSSTQEARREALEVIGVEAKKMAMADPLRYLQFGFVRLKHILWTTAEAGVRSTQEGSEYLQSLPEKTVTRLCEVSKHFSRVLLVLSLLGLLGFRLQGRNLEGMALMSLYLFFWLGFHYLIAISSDRWAVQIIPFIVMFAAGGLAYGIRYAMAWIKSVTPQPLGSN